MQIQKIAPQLWTFYIKFHPFLCCFLFIYLFPQGKLQSTQTRRVYDESAGKAFTVAFPGVLLQLGLGR